MHRWNSIQTACFPALSLELNRALTVSSMIIPGIVYKEIQVKACSIQSPQMWWRNVMDSFGWKLIISFQ